MKTSIQREYERGLKSALREARKAKHPEAATIAVALAEVGKGPVKSFERIVGITYRDVKAIGPIYDGPVPILAWAIRTGWLAEDKTKRDEAKWQKAYEALVRYDLDGAIVALDHCGSQTLANIQQTLVDERRKRAGDPVVETTAKRPKHDAELVTLLRKVAELLNSAVELLKRHSEQ